MQADFRRSIFTSCGMMLLGLQASGAVVTTTSDPSPLTFTAPSASRSMIDVMTTSSDKESLLKRSSPLWTDDHAGQLQVDFNSGSDQTPFALPQPIAPSLDVITSTGYPITPDQSPKQAAHVTKGFSSKLAENPKVLKPAVSESESVPDEVVRREFSPLDVPAVPEPASLGLLACASALMLPRRGCRRR